MALKQPRSVVASAARTATGNSGTIVIDDRGRNVVLAVNCSAVSGTTPTLDLSVEWSQDGGTTWYVGDTADSFVQITAAKQTVKGFTLKGNAYRIKWTIGGTTPSFTFDVNEYMTP